MTEVREEEQPTTTFETDGEQIAKARTEASDGSIFGGLREARKKIQEDDHVDLAVPGYSGRLIVRYGIPDWDRLYEVQQKVSRGDDPDTDLHAQMDVLIWACHTEPGCVLMKKGDETKPLHEWNPDWDTPVHFDERLAEAIEADVDPNSIARSVLFATFGENKLAIGNHFGRLFNWASVQRGESSQDF